MREDEFFERLGVYTIRYEADKNHSNLTDIIEDIMEGTRRRTNRFAQPKRSVEIGA